MTRIGSVLVVTALCLLGAPSVASATPDNPSDVAIAAAQQAADAAAHQVGQIAAELADVRNQVGQAEAAANIALGRYEETQSAYDTAHAAAEQAQAVAHHAEAAQAAAQAELTAFARASYEQGSTTPDFEAALTSDGPSQMLERAVLLASADAHRTDVLAQVTLARQQATATGDAATAAVSSAATLQQQARTDLSTATALEVTARQQAAGLQAHQSELQARLRIAQQTLVRLQDARAAALAYQQRQQAAAARAAAAAAASRPAAASSPPASSPAASPPAASPPAARASRPAPGAAAPVITASRGNASVAQAAIAAALKRVGEMYAWGGGSLTGPSEGFGPDVGVIGFDCSGLTRYAYAQGGIQLPRVAADQYAVSPKVADLQPGDLVFYATDPGDPATIHHVAMYLGNDRIIEAPESGEPVQVTAMRYGYEYIGAVRPSAAP